MLDALREIAWFKNAAKEFNKFPLDAQRQIMGDLTLAAEGEKGDLSKPFKGTGSGVFEIPSNIVLMLTGPCTLS